MYWLHQYFGTIRGSKFELEEPMLVEFFSFSPMAHPQQNLMCHLVFAISPQLFQLSISIHIILVLWFHDYIHDCICSHMSHSWLHDYVVNTNSSTLPSSHKHGHNHIITSPCDINNICDQIWNMLKNMIGHMIINMTCGLCSN
jgi:hypothetical protein